MGRGLTVGTGGPGTSEEPPVFNAPALCSGGPTGALDPDPQYRAGTALPLFQKKEAECEGSPHPSHSGQRRSGCAFLRAPPAALVCPTGPSSGGWALWPEPQSQARPHAAHSVGDPKSGLFLGRVGCKVVAKASLLPLGLQPVTTAPEWEVGAWEGPCQGRFAVFQGGCSSGPDDQASSCSLAPSPPCPRGRCSRMRGLGLHLPSPTGRWLPRPPPPPDCVICPDGQTDVRVSARLLAREPDGVGAAVGVRQWRQYGEASQGPSPRASKGEPQDFTAEPAGRAQLQPAGEPLAPRLWTGRA